MKAVILREMLLISEPSVMKLHQEMMNIANYLIAPMFLIALGLEYFGEMNFGGVVKKLLIVSLVMSFFYQFHSAATDIALESASKTLMKISPRNIFVKKWNEVKVRTKKKKDGGLVERFITPNLNDLVATGFFIISKAFIWILKLIYSTVYHFTYVFSGITAILYFLGWTKDSLKATFQGSIWCMLMPYVVVAILALVGNSFDEAALSGELMISKIDTIVWLFGVTLLLVLSPVITYGMVKGEGIQSFASKMGTMVTNSGMRAALMLPLASMGNRIKVKLGGNGRSKNRSSYRKGGSQLTERGVSEKTHQSSKSANDKSHSASTTQGYSQGNVPKSDTQKYSSQKGNTSATTAHNRMSQSGQSSSKITQADRGNSRGTSPKPGMNQLKENTKQTQGTGSRVVNNQHKSKSHSVQDMKHIHKRAETLSRQYRRPHGLQ